jgi:hypothetical protein
MRDVREVLSNRSPHHWVALTLALLIPIAIITAFMFDTVDAHDAPEQLIYVNSWRADRTIEETRAQIAADELRRQEYEAERRRQFQRLDDSLTNLGI